jgi:hypothetical protein
MLVAEAVWSTTPTLNLTPLPLLCVSCQNRVKKYSFQLLKGRASEVKDSATSPMSYTKNNRLPPKGLLYQADEKIAL